MESSYGPCGWGRALGKNWMLSRAGSLTCTPWPRPWKALAAASVSASPVTGWSLESIRSGAAFGRSELTNLASKIASWSVSSDHRVGQPTTFVVNIDDQLTDGRATVEREDPDTSVKARVGDLAGNKTTVTPPPRREPPPRRGREQTRSRFLS